MSSIDRSENLITTYMERSLHAQLKKYFCPDEAFHEMKIGKYFADACDKNTIFEIQTGNLSPLAKKMDFYLQNTDLDIVIVRPIAQSRRIFWINEQGELQKAPRKSAKHESIADGVADLYYLKNYIGEPRIKFCFVMMEINEVRRLDGYGKQKKIRATSMDRFAGEIYSLSYISNACDIKNAVFPILPNEKFDREALSRSLRLKGLKLWSAQKLLVELEILSVEKDGRKLIFEK